jgi:hypothetical protein
MGNYFGRRTLCWTCLATGGVCVCIGITEVSDACLGQRPSGYWCPVLAQPQADVPSNEHRPPLAPAGKLQVTVVSTASASSTDIGKIGKAGALTITLA